jgi:hypothetical protein
VAGLKPAACRLDATGRREQAARYRRLSASVASVTRRDDALDVTFAAGVDLSLLEAAVDVERACCPFFDLRLDDQARTLHVAVSAPRERPALDALEAAMYPEGDPNG